ncbi:MAG TPA: ABC transporter permease [Alphaproteobacteria bacterium]|nr:ABC transporter permease [Alphaproteobacteria bacterium]
MHRQWFHETWLRLKALALRRKLDRDLEDEIAFHLAMREQKHRSAGTAQEDARALSRRQFGNAAKLKEACRRMWTFNFWETVGQDVRFGLRTLRKNPGFAAIAILTLALGIGANTAIFSLTHQIMLRALPVQNPDELVILRVTGLASGSYHSDGDIQVMFSYPLYKDLRERSQVFSGLLARYPFQASVAGQSFSERAAGELVSGNYFEVLGVPPALGRILTTQDETAPGANRVCVLSYGYWTRRFANNPSVLNQRININGTALTVVGVAQAGFTGVQIGQMPDIFVPVSMKAQMTPNWDAMRDYREHWLAVIGRLKPGLNQRQAEAALQGVYHSLLEVEAPLLKIPPKNQQRFLANALVLDPGVRGRPILQRDAQLPLVFMSTIVGLVLLIACANLAGLLIAKGEGRQREIAVRISLGAGRWRIIRQLLTESLLLAVAGGLASLAFASWTLHLMVSSVAVGAGIVDLHARLDGEMLLFALVLSVVTGILFGLTPAMRMVQGKAHSAVKQPGSAATDAVGNVRLRKLLMIFQVAVTVVLLAGAGLCAQSLINLERTNLGLQISHLLQFSVSPEMNHYTPQQTITFVERQRQEIAALPGVRSVSAAQVAVFTDSENTQQITSLNGQPFPDTEDSRVEENWIGPNYFSTMQIPLAGGREFTDSDNASNAKVVIINETMARKFFKTQNPIGGHFSLTLAPGAARPEYEIVGVVKDSKHDNVRDPISPFVYFPYAQNSRLGQVTFYVRTSGDPELVTAAVRKTVSAVDSSLPLFDVKTLAQQVNDSMLVDRLLAVMSLCFGVLAALLAVIGLYGVMAYVVARRTREIGIRIALGATRKVIAWMVLREVVRMAAIGLAVGLILAFAGGRLITSLLFGVSGSSPIVLAFTAGALAMFALLAGSLPARRAARVEPVVALRYE